MLIKTYTVINMVLGGTFGKNFDFATLKRTIAENERQFDGAVLSQ
jgi:hypothetical protein